MSYCSKDGFMWYFANLALEMLAQCARIDTLIVRDEEVRLAEHTCQGRC
jgi:hypothetical protein